MSDIAGEVLELEGTRISLKQDGEVPELVFEGKIDMLDPGMDIQPFILELHMQLLEKGVKQLSVDFTALTFMNSSGLKVMVNWIMKLKDAPAATRYRMVFVRNKDITWQGSSLPILQKLLPELISVEVR